MLYIAAVRVLPRSRPSMISSDIARDLSTIREKDLKSLIYLGS